MPSPRHVVRNARLLLQSAAQHFVDDPVLLAVQASRRLPFAVRVRGGRALRAVCGRVPGASGAAALGAFMAGEEAEARRLIARSTGSRSRLRGEVAVMLGLFHEIVPDAPPFLRARASWMRGDLSVAATALHNAGRSTTRYARRLESELQLLRPGHRLPLRGNIAQTLTESTDSDKIRVLHVLTNSLPHTQSGYSLRSHRILTALRDQGIESVALTRTGYPVMVGRPGAADEDHVDGIRYVRTLPNRLPQTQEGRLEVEVERALELVASFRPHVIHATTNYYNALVAEEIAARTGLPWVLEFRGLMEMTWVAAQRTRQNQRAAAASEKVRLVAARESELAVAADAVVTLSETMRAELGQRGAHPESIAVVPNGVDDALLADHLTPAEARSKLGLTMGDAFIVGSVSAVVEYEGLDILLRAVAHLLADGATPMAIRKGLRVLIVGDGQAGPGLRALADDLGIADRTIMPGRVSRQTARDWVQALDVVVIPRLDVEVARTVTPQKPVEAMALGRPVIISDLPALRETVTGTAGSLCALVHAPGSVPELADAIMVLATDPARARHLVELGREAATERTWAYLVREYCKVYANVISQKERRRGR